MVGSHKISRHSRIRNELVFLRLFLVCAKHLQQKKMPLPIRTVLKKRRPSKKKQNQAIASIDYHDEQQHKHLISICFVPFYLTTFAYATSYARTTAAIRSSFTTNQTQRRKSNVQQERKKHHLFFALSLNTDE